MGKKVIMAAVLAILIIFFVGCWFNKGSQISQITVDASKSMGEMPETLKVGIFGQGVSDYDNKKYIKDNANKLGYTRDQLFVDSGFSDSTSEPTEAEWNEYYQMLSGYVKTYSNFEKNGAKIGFDFEGMPRWLSSRPNNNNWQGNAESFTMCRYSPPRDYDKFTDLFFRTADYFQKNGMQNIWFAPWNEPDWTFAGTPDEFMKTYKAMIIGVKRANKNFLVGGPSVSGLSIPLNIYDEKWTELGRSDKPLIEIFIESSSKMSIPELGYDRLPIEFIDFHFPGNNLEQDAEYVRGLLTKYGYDPDKVKIRIGEWVLTPYGDLPSTELNSAYFIKRVKEYSENGLYSTLTSFEDQAGWTDSGWTDVGIFFGSWDSNHNNNRSSIIKPVYNSFHALSILNGKPENQTTNRLQATFNEDDFITAISSQTKDKTKTRILISSFIPQNLKSNGMLTDYLLDKFYTSSSMQSTKAYQDEIKACVGTSKDANKVQQCTSGILNKITDPILKRRFQTQVNLQVCLIQKKGLQCFLDAQNTTTDELTKQDIENLKQEYEKMVKYQTTPKEVTINLKNLPFSGKATLTTYTIDRDHSNSCRYNKRTEPTPTDTECGINGAVDRAVKQAKDEAKAKALQILNDMLKDKSYSDNDISRILQLAETSGGDINKVKSAIQQQYSTLDRCKNKICNFETVWGELILSYTTYKEAYDTLFYYGKYASNGKTITTSVWIDKINNDPNISLEGSRQTKEITITGNTYQETITMQPYSVILVEIKK